MNIHEETLNIARNLIKKDPSLTDWVVSKFPELKDEDERIRKELIDFVKSRLAGFPQCEKFIDWLEKQGNNKLIWKHWSNGIAGNGAGKLIYLIKEGNNYRLSSCLAFECDYIELSELDNLILEKQGEQKPTIIIPKFRVGDEIKTTNETPLTITKIDEKGYWSESLFICSFDNADKWKLVEQKPYDKVEPKFRIGDFVKNTNYQGEPIYEIVYIDKECYICEYRGKENMGDKTVMHFAFDNPYLRLVEQNPAWSEEDEYYRNIIRYCLNGECVGNADKENAVLWLKSLKNRVQLQPKQEWKPSEEQLRELENVFSPDTDSWNEDVLRELYKQLKQL